MTKQQTALQELIEWIKNGGADGTTPLSNVISKATELLEKEKNIIVDAFYHGSFHQIGKDGETYYHQTYIQ